MSGRIFVAGDPLDGDALGKVTNTQPSSTDYGRVARIVPGPTYLEAVALGLVPGVSGVGLVGIDSAIAQTESTVGPVATGRYPFQSAAVAMEAVSTSANDTSAGSGARTIFVDGLDASYVRQTELVTMNGTTPVALASNYFRINRILTATPEGQVNAGIITVRVVSGSVAQSAMAAGANRSQDGVFTTAAATYNLLLSSVPDVNKDNDSVFRVYRKSVGLPFFLRAELSVYQNLNPRDFIVPVGIPEKTDIELTGQTTNPSGASGGLTQQILVDTNRTLSPPVIGSLSMESG